MLEISVGDCSYNDIIVVTRGRYKRIGFISDSGFNARNAPFVEVQFSDDETVQLDQGEMVELVCDATKAVKTAIELIREGKLTLEELDIYRGASR